MAALYLDEDAQRTTIVQGLTRRGVDVLTAKAAGMLGRADEEQLAYATRAGRVLFSYNVRDYVRIHVEMLAAGETHGGIVLAPKERFHFGEQIRRLERLCLARTAEQMLNTIEFLQRWGDETE